MEERRRSVRRAVDGEVATVPAFLNVQVVDISTAGVLLQSTHRVERGTRGRLRLSLGGAPFVADIRVMRVAAAPDAAPGYRLGASFVALPAELRHLLEQFMTH